MKIYNSKGGPKFGGLTVVVVDQSTDEVTKKAISKYLKNPQFTYIKSDSVGSSAGRNIAIEDSESELVAITDDVKAFAGSKDVLDIKALTAVGEKLDVKAFKIKGNVFDIKALTPISHFSFYLSHK